MLSLHSTPMNQIKNYIKRFTPSPLLQGYRKMRSHVHLIKMNLKETSLVRKISYYRTQKNYDNLIRNKNNKETINVVFFALFKSVWKYDELYQLLEKHPRFNPSIIVCPIINLGEENMIQNLNESFSYFKSLGYNVYKGLDTNSNPINVKELFNPDIIFFCSPYDTQVDENFILDKYKNDTLTCYIQYGINEAQFKWSYDLKFHRNIWKFWCESETLKDYYLSQLPKGLGTNFVATGYPLYESFLKSAECKEDNSIWKKDTRKRIIWAPHHSIDNCGGLQYSTFLLYHKTMLDIAQIYKERIQLVFKPHPLLKNKLYKDKEWGKTRTDAYFQQWDEMENTSFQNGEYTDLFTKSDAIIHDCASFLIEYLYTQKPALYLVLNKGHESELNPFGLKAYKTYYHAIHEKDIYGFIENVVLKGEDDKAQMRLSFYKEELEPKDGIKPSQKIVNHIIQCLDKQE